MEKTMTSPSECRLDHDALLQELIDKRMAIGECPECQTTLRIVVIATNEPLLHLTVEEVSYLVANIQHEYLNKDTYYFASNLFGRMQRFLDGLAKSDSQTT